MIDSIPNPHIGVLGATNHLDCNSWLEIMFLIMRITSDTSKHT